MDIVKLTEKQILGIEIATRRYQQRESFTCIAGYAGTGKSTLVKYLIEKLGISPKKVAYATFTGKAALVLQRKGHTTATTLHKLLYNSFKKPDGSFAHIPKKELDYPFEIIVIDEVSMCPKPIWEQALRMNTHIIALGDPF